MGYEHRVDSVYRPAIYQVSAEPLPQRTKPETAVTGLEKSTALAELEAGRAASVFPGDRKGSHINSQADQPESSPQLSFSDLIDVINPLQHIPLVSTAYRALTGDEISAPARVAGSTLFFGPLGAAAAVTNVVSESLTGKDVGENIASVFGLEGEETTESFETVDASSLTPPEDLPEASAAPSTASYVPGADNEALSPDEPFTFGQPVSPDTTVPTQAIGFAGSSEPIALQSLPADILAALYSGQTVRPVAAADSSKPTPETGTTPISSPTSPPPDYANAVEPAPRWNLWSSPDEALAPANVAARAYSGGVDDNSGVPGGAHGPAAWQAGWAAASAPEVLARYQDSVNLQREASRPYVDVSQ